MFDLNSSAGIEIRNLILKDLGAGLIHHDCRCSFMQEPFTVCRVIYNDPATIVYWSDHTRTVVKCQPGDKFDPETGFLLALCKKVCGNTGNYNNLLRECVPGYGGEKVQAEPSVEQMRKELYDFCHPRSCKGCPLDKDGFKCGRGNSFTSKTYEHGYMTDELIVKHYKAMKKGESSNDQ